MKFPILCVVTLLGLTLNAATPPNVLLILVDDLKPAIGAYGDPVAITPHLDRLASRGTRFDLAFCNQAVCAPSRNNLFTGLRSTTTGLYTLGLNFRHAVPDAVTLPQYFRSQGYHAASLGKVYHIGHGNVNDDASWSIPHHKELVIEYADPASKPAGRLTREEAMFSNYRGDSPVQDLPRSAAWESPEVPDESYADGRIAAEAARRLLAHAADPRQPFFLAVGFARPHLPFSAPRRYWDLYRREHLPLTVNPAPPADAPGYAIKRKGEITNYDPIPLSGDLDADLQRTLVHGYYASTSYVDAQIGKVLDALDQTGLAANTIVIVWGDHGFHLGDHGSWTKHSNHEQANRIPLIFAGPGIAAGAATQSVAETVDIFPTLCDLAGLPAPRVPQGLDGSSHAPALRHPGTVVDTYAYHAYPRGGAKGENFLGRAIRTNRHRLVEWKTIGAPADTAEFELYDYWADPHETHNLASAQPGIVAALRLLLAQHPEARPQSQRRP
ncbi:MAG: iduronate 2-sulfatase [Verrucomicrobiota bacterium]|nr:iduronate 2-sulfatase [Verrucomicrobiota bacterium]